MTMTAPLQPTAIHAIPAELCDCGFRLLMMRQFNAGAVPPAFAIIDQRLMRMPERRGRHGVSFAATFLPEVMSWLIDHLGRPRCMMPPGAPIAIRAGPWCAGMTRS